jgi:uncharacterized membrane protein YphA (DoxX/SURF4 family)
MKTAYTIVRVIFGLWFTYAGIEYFIPGVQPFGTTAIAQQFTHALVDSGLMLIVKIMELIGGVLILLNRAILPSALAMLPLSVVIAFWNIVLDPVPPVGYALGVVTPLFNLILIWPYRARLIPLLTWKPASA